jgi:hypothetical protein
MYITEQPVLYVYDKCAREIKSLNKNFVYSKC